MGSSFHTYSYVNTFVAALLATFLITVSMIKCQQKYERSSLSRSSSGKFGSQNNGKFAIQKQGMFESTEEEIVDETDESFHPCDSNGIELCWGLQRNKICFAMRNRWKEPSCMEVEPAGAILVKNGRSCYFCMCKFLIYYWFSNIKINFINGLGQKSSQATKFLFEFKFYA